MCWTNTSQKELPNQEIIEQKDKGPVNDKRENKLMFNKKTHNISIKQQMFTASSTKLNPETKFLFQSTYIFLSHVIMLYSSMGIRSATPIRM